MLERRCPEHVELLTLCSTSSLAVLHGSGGHERIFVMEAPFLLRCRVMLLQIRGDMGVTNVGLFLLKLVLVT